MNLHTLPRLPAAALTTLSSRQEEAAFALLSFSGGIAGGFGSVFCGHVFANAQTGSMISMASELYAGQWLGVASRLGGLALFVLGIALTVVLPARLFGGDSRRWQRACLLVETFCFALQGLLPREALSVVSYALYLWPVFFAAALQYNTFTALHGVPVSTLFCTNNLRQLTLHALIWRRMRRARTPEAAAEARRELRISLTYLVVTLLFFAGVVFSVFTLELLGAGQMFLCAGLLFALWLWRTAAARAQGD
ncbi:MAG TPA: DUF1275 domain-containing protein [Candidatus Gemmiger faecigallinarum]|nr:DUF1275 domain-containing protein [Candidatus Gemmiger faecigallinarum]